MTSQTTAKTRTASVTAEPAPFQDRDIEAGGVRLHYLDYGTAGRHPLLCIHGGAASAHWFDYVAGAFTGDYHVRALDQRGHGDSAWVDPPAYAYADYAADINRVVEKLDLRDFYLIGHSMGGMVSLVYTATYPGRVKKLVVVDTSIKLSEERLGSMRERGSRAGTQYKSREDLSHASGCARARSRRRKSCSASPATARSSFPTAHGSTSSTATSMPYARRSTGCRSGRA